ncbi:hypothetical protein AJ80_07142 [Polytolypa hystricis UAMH7299]|uniref:Uncharacterized protein n=1 Tax=Polytolypa hystricis (strain UAMH7299) TaxID=1447883 RepID=A0A2B7XRU5_POLH7|nr:hypothetical protein AJ80_07142 [Polytolypa hystricis UAMH7299]
MRLASLVIFTIALLGGNASAFRLRNGCHWWILVVVCKGPQNQGTPANNQNPPPASCPANCQPGISQSELAAGNSNCPGQPSYFDSGANFACCGPLYNSGAPGAQPSC